MDQLLGRYSFVCYAALRIVAGLMFTLHGTQKLFGFPGDRAPVALNSLLGAAGLIELVTGLLITVGLFTGYAAFLASGEMAVAYFYAHAPHGFWPILNQGELAALYCFLFLYIAARGAVAYGLDTSLRRTSPRAAGAAA